MAAHLEQGLGSAIEAIFYPSLGSLHRDVARLALDDPTTESTQLRDWGQVVRGDQPTSPDIQKVQLLLAEAGKPYVPEAFLYVHVVWGDGSEEHWGHLDRPTGRFQILGKIVTAGKIKRAYSQDRRIQRVQTDLDVENVDGGLGPKILTKSQWMKARFSIYVAERSLPRESYRPVASEFRIDRPPEVKEGVVTFALINSVEDASGYRIKLPPLRLARSFTPVALKAKLDIVIQTGAAQSETYKVLSPGGQQGFKAPTWNDSVEEKPIPVVFGREVAPVPWAWAKSGADGGPQVGNSKNFWGFIVLGASKTSEWLGPAGYWGTSPETGNWRVPGGKELELWVAGLRKDRLDYRWVGVNKSLSEVVEENAFFEPKPLLHWSSLTSGRYLPPSGVYLWIDYVTDPAAPNGFGGIAAEDGGRWYIAVLTIALDGDLFAGLSGTTTEGFLSDIQNAAVAGSLLFRTPFGAEGPNGEELLVDGQIVQLGHEPPIIAKKILERYAGGDLSRLDSESFAEAATAYLGRSVAGLIAEDRASIDVVEELAATFEFDIHYGPLNTLICRPARTTFKDLAQRIPAAKVYTDEHDIAPGSWWARPAAGDERWGFANFFKLDGLKDHILLAQPELQNGYDGSDASAGDIGGRIYQQTLQVGWFPQWDPGDFTIDLGQAAAIRQSDQRLLFGFTGGIQLLEQDLGEWLYAEHWAAPSLTPAAGKPRLLGRVEVVEFDPETWRVDVQCADFTELVTKRPWVIDRSSYWLRQGPLGATGRGLVFTAGSEFVQSFGFDFDVVGTQVQDLIWIGNKSAAHANHKKVLRVIDVGMGTQVEVVDAKTGAPFFATVNETVYVGWKVLRSHLTPPNNTTHPGKYPYGSEIYGRVCDGATGKFSNGNDGYILR